MALVPRLVAHLEGTDLPTLGPDNVTEPMEADFAKQVEYDMDEQGERHSQDEFSPTRADATTSRLADKVWLDMVNAERKRDGHAPISYEVFEIVMDKIEKEWFDLVSWSDCIAV